MAFKILVVDDEPQLERLLRQRFRRQITDNTYELLFASNGVEALDIVRHDNTIQMLLCDINMPQMDGLTLLGKLNGERPLLKTVIVSAYGDMKNIRLAMNRGAFDFITKPIDFIDLEKTINKTLREIKLLIASAEAQAIAEENEKLLEADRLKTEFFTDISHEFRTPLTVINGMTEQIKEQPLNWTTRGLAMIKRNTDDLLDLVNQILDLRKLESGKLYLQVSQIDIIPQLNYLAETFRIIAEAKDILLRFESTVTEILMDHDVDKIQRVVSNLLGNALKFTPEGGEIFFNVDRENDILKIQVRDTGEGISDEHLPHIFQRFYRGKSAVRERSMSTGIGLSLVEKLVKLMKGSIQVESETQVGTTFTLLLPIKNIGPLKINEVTQSPTVAFHLNAFPQSRPVDDTMKSDITSIFELPNLLIIEDNEDMAQYIATCLEGRYTLDFAPDGQTGINKATADVPDLIISDIMMPFKNGYEVCEILKKDTITSHVPIVLLTAKADLSSRKIGLEKGADAYLQKPFDRQELLIQINNLLELREQLQKKYGDPDLMADTTILHQNSQDQFISNLHQQIGVNLDDDAFGILELCKALGVSRTQLHRKIKALTGKSTSLYVRSIRLGKAKELLVKSKLNISEIAYSVGFKDPKYFSRTFTEEFGLSPKNWRS